MSLTNVDLEGMIMDLEDRVDKIEKLLEDLIDNLPHHMSYNL